MGKPGAITLVISLAAVGSTACATTTERIVTPARSARGRMGFGVLATTQSQPGGSFTASRAGVAGASAAGVQPGGGDFVWRIAEAGSKLELCHAGWSTRPCRTALFDGGPNTMAPFLKFSVSPSLIDPVNLGRVQLVSTDSRGNVWVFGNLKANLDKFTVPATPSYGVWAFGGGSRLHHCQLEGEKPNCRAVKMAGDGAVAGALLSIKTYGEGAEMREGAWFGGFVASSPGAVDSLAFQHCEARSGSSEAPVCAAAKLGGAPPSREAGLFGPRVLSSHVVAEGGRPGHVIWFQTLDGSIGRCQARTGEAPVCGLAKRD